jgi:hypothetical protein
VVPAGDRGAARNLVLTALTIAAPRQGSALSVPGHGTRDGVTFAAADAASGRVRLAEPTWDTIEMRTVEDPAQHHGASRRHLGWR